MTGRTGWLRLQGIALFGSSAEGLVLAALPLIAASLTTDPREVSLVTAAGQLPWIVFPLFVGVMIDRMRLSSLLGTALVVQVAACLTLGFAAKAVPALMVVAFVLVLGQVVTEGSRGALVPRIADDLDAANSRLLIIDLGVVRFLAPPVAGLLVAWNGAGVGWFAAVSCAVAALLAYRLPAFDRAPRPPAIHAPRPAADHAPANRASQPAADAVPRKAIKPFGEIREGLRYLVGSRLLRSITVAVSVASFAWFFGYATFALYATEVLGLGAAGYGVLLASMAAGFTVGAFLGRRVIARLGHPNAMRTAVSIEIAAKLSLAFCTSPYAAAAVLFVHSIATFTWNVSSQSTRQRYTPTELLGRVLTSHRALSWGVAPIGAALGGLAAARFGLSHVWIIAAVIQAVGVALIWRALSARPTRSPAEHVDEATRTAKG